MYVFTLPKSKIVPVRAGFFRSYQITGTNYKPLLKSQGNNLGRLFPQTKHLITGHLVAKLELQLYQNSSKINMKANA